MAQRFAKLVYSKTNRRIAAGALFTGLLLKNSLKHIFPEDLFFPFYAYRSNELHVVNAVKLVSACKSDMGISHSASKMVPFVSATTEACSAGFSAFGFCHSHIGIPASFFCETLEELSHHNLFMGKISGLKPQTGKAFEKVDPNEIKLMKSLLLSEDAQKFAIARQISYIQRNWALYQSLIPSIFVLVGYYLFYQLPRLLFSSRRNVHLNYILGVSFSGALLAYVMCKLTSAALSRKILIQADLDAAKVSPQYVKGGIEMYEKLRDSCSALRVLLGRKGERMYTEDGNLSDGLIPWFSNTSPSFTERIKCLNGVMTTETQLVAKNESLTN